MKTFIPMYVGFSRFILLIALVESYQGMQAGFSYTVVYISLFICGAIVVCLSSVHQGTAGHVKWLDLSSRAWLGKK